MLKKIIEYRFIVLLILAINLVFAIYQIFYSYARYNSLDTNELIPQPSIYQKYILIKNSKSYISAWANGDYVHMYAYISPDSTLRDSKFRQTCLSFLKAQHHNYGKLSNKIYPLNIQVVSEPYKFYISVFLINLHLKNFKKPPSANLFPNNVATVRYNLNKSTYYLVWIRRAGLWKCVNFPTDIDKVYMRAYTPT